MKGEVNITFTHVRRGRAPHRKIKQVWRLAKGSLLVWQGAGVGGRFVILGVVSGEGIADVVTFG